MAIHVDIGISNLEVLRETAKQHGKSVRDMATETLNGFFCKDRSVIILTPAAPQEFIDELTPVLGKALSDKELWAKVKEFITNAEKEKEDERIQNLKIEDATIQ